MVRLPLTPAEVERGERLGALLRRARGQRSMLHTALDAGVSAFIQPGGSKRDPEVIEAVSSAGAAMVLTGQRHFRH